MSALILFLGGLCWVLSLWFPAFYTDTNTVMGYWVLVTGWLGFISFQFAWFANLLALLAVLWMSRYPIRATLISAGAVLLATQTFWFNSIPGKYENMSVIGLGAGFWLWYVSLALLCVGVVFGSDHPAPEKEVIKATPPPEPHPAVRQDPVIQPNPFAVKPPVETSFSAANDEKLLEPVAFTPFDEATPLADLVDANPQTNKPQV